ncbi:MAG: penicillin acylase family protein [Bacteroidia bacterium]|nr:penicillin acylase family protein [Bacteroidia bacterium]MDW8015583.1 penicillin acylase family protein [Bacteroidia bacterium]
MLKWLLIGVGWGLLLAQEWNPQRIVIYRDSLGVAHVWAPTDAEAAYGLGWVQAEDVPLPLQYNLLAAKGLLGKVLGKEGAVWDFLLYFTGIDTIDFQKGMSPETWRLLEGFAAGVNSYFHAHPEKRLLPEAFPIRAEDVARGTHLVLNLLAGLGRALKWVRTSFLSDVEELMEGYGSNAWAIAPHRSADQGTWLLINSHQELEGRFAWYEVHVGSAEGWNFIGGTFPGAPLPFIGTNPALGWGHTLAYHHLTEVYLLNVRGRRYQYDSSWLPFKQRRVRLSLKGLPFPLFRTVYSTEYGPALQVKGKWYAFAQLSYTETRALEQWYRMSRARSFHSFMEALKLHALPTLNTVYADEEGHIAFFSWVHLPERDSAVEWRIPIRFPLPAHRLRAKVSVEALPTVIDPPCGYVYNANQTPLRSTCPSSEWRPKRSLIGLQRFTYNRGERLAELWAKHEGKVFTLEQLRQIKHDRCYASEGSYRRVFAELFALSPLKYPRLAEAIQAVKRWGGCAEPTDTLTALVMLTHLRLEKLMRLSMAEALILLYAPTEAEVVRALRWAVKTLKKKYGTLYPQWSQVFRHGRGGVEVGVGGAPEVLEARHWQWDSQRDVLRVKGGDGLIYWVGWTPQGQVIYSIQPLGASHVAESPYYTNFILPFSENRLFPRTLEWEKVRSTAVRVYHPAK